MPRFKGMLVVLVMGFLLAGFSGSVTVLGSPPTSKLTIAISLKQKMVKVRTLRHRIDQHRQATWRWQDIPPKSHTATIHQELRTTGVPYLKWLVELWSERRTKAKQYAVNPPHKSEWLCIHGNEAAWDNPGIDWRGDPSPFFGGLQFMQSTWERNGGLRYALRADLATPLEQMWVAENAWKESGGSFSQWPNTARKCGLPT